MGYVYLIHDKDKDVYKIGVTKSNSSKRLKQLQTGNSTELNIIYLFKTEYPFRLETMLHKHFNNQNVRGEWFKLDNIDDYMKVCENTNNIIESLKDNPFFSKKLH